VTASAVAPWAIGLAGATPVAAWRHRRRTSRD
jgi:signal peptidase I